MNLKFSARGVYGGRSATGTSLYWSTPLIPCHYHPRSAPYWCLIHLPSTLHNQYSLSSWKRILFRRLVPFCLQLSCVALYPELICLRVACYWKTTNVCVRFEISWRWGCKLWGCRLYKTVVVSFMYLETEGEVCFDEIMWLQIKFSLKCQCDMKFLLFRQLRHAQFEGRVRMGNVYKPKQRSLDIWW
jgi:hypothetical protein